MSRKRRQGTNTTDQAIVTLDGFINPRGRVGMGTDNPQARSRYQSLQYITKDRSQLDSMFRQSWIVRKAITAVAEDMTREGVEILSNWQPDGNAAVKREMTKLQIWPAFMEVIQWARLYGGAALVPLIDGQDLSTPLDPSTVGKGQFRGFKVFDRWTLQPDLNNLVTEFGPQLGDPKYYEIIGQEDTGQRVHYTRVFRFIGDPLPYWERQREEGWGASVIESFFDRLIAFDSTTEGISQLVYRAYLRTIRINGYRKILAAGGHLKAALHEQMDNIRLWQQNEGLTLLDKDDEFQTSAYTFAGLSDVLLSIGEQVAGATNIPLVRLFGQSPAGLNATGESDIRSYYDLIGAKQDKDLTTPMYWTFVLLSRSMFGEPLPEDFAFDFKPLWKLDDIQKSDISQKDTTAISAAFDSGIISQQTALRELRENGQISGRWSNVSDEEIAQAESGPPGIDELEIVENMVPEAVNAPNVESTSEE